MSDTLMNLTDIAFLSLMLFFLFFLGLVIYLRKEDRREGYPLENELTGRPEDMSLAFVPSPKTFIRPHGQSAVEAPNMAEKEREVATRRLGGVPGSPYEPTGNPMLDGVGPGSWVERENVPEMDYEGHPKLAPMRAEPGFSVVRGDPDPRGMTVIGCDGAAAGKVADLWVDKPEAMIRYFEVELDGETPKKVLLPVTMANVQKSRGVVKVDAITGAQFADVPELANPDQVTKLEEERVAAYYGGGFLYATPERLESSL